DIPEPIVDTEYPTDDYGTMSLSIPAGRQHLNGDLALAYARTRHQDSDFGRMGRQQQVAAAVVQRLKQPMMLLKLPSILGVESKAVRTDLGGADLPSVGLALSSMSGDKAHRLVIGPDLVTPLTGADGAALLQPSSNL